jgi:hypothetical protein
VQPHTLGAAAHVSTHLRRQEERHVLCVCGHSRHVVVHWSAGAHVPVELHHPQPGASAEHAQTSAAKLHAAGDETLRSSAAPPKRVVCGGGGRHVPASAAVVVGQQQVAAATTPSHQRDIL